MKNYLIRFFSLLCLNSVMGDQYFVSGEINGNFAMFIIAVLISFIFIMLLLFVVFYYFKTRFIRQRSILLKKLNKELSKEISDKEKSIHRLKTDIELLIATIRSIGDGLISTDVNGMINFMNKTAENITGWTEQEALGRPFYEIYVILSDPGFKEMGQRTANEDISGNSFEKTILRMKDGTERNIREHRRPIKENNGEIIGLVILFKEETTKIGSEVPLKKDNKLQSLANDISEISHTFNNIFIGILGNISYVRSKLNYEDDLYAILNQAEEAALKARDLTSKLFSVTEKLMPKEKQPVAFPDFLKNTIRSSFLGSSVKTKFSFSDDLWDVAMNHNKFRHVFHTISINARDAMPKGGVFHVRVKNVVIKTEENLPIKPGNYVKVSIRDQPAGITQTQLDSRFDSPLALPVEENKELAAIYSIIANQHGYMYAETEKELGTNLIIYFPAKATDPEGLKLYRESSILSNTGRILVMDDEIMIRNIAGRLLRFIGYEVVTVTSGDETILEYNNAMQKNKKFDVVVLDLTVAGGMGGKETIKRLKEIDPHVKAVVSSGYSDNPIMTDYRKYGFVDLIAKPYKIYELGEVIFRVMNNR